MFPFSGLEIQKKLDFFPLFLSDAHSKANVNMRLTSLRWETDPVRKTQTRASKYRRLGRAFASARITTWRPCLSTIGRNRWVSTRWRKTFVFKPQGTTTIYVAAKGSVKSLTNILKKRVFLPPSPISMGPALLFSLLCFWLFPLKLTTVPPH